MRWKSHGYCSSRGRVSPASGETMMTLSGLKGITGSVSVLGTAENERERTRRRESERTRESEGESERTRGR